MHHSSNQLVYATHKKSTHLVIIVVAKLCRSICIGFSSQKQSKNPSPPQVENLYIPFNIENDAEWGSRSRFAPVQSNVECWLLHFHNVESNKIQNERGRNKIEIVLIIGVNFIRPKSVRIAKNVSAIYVAMILN